MKIDTVRKLRSTLLGFGILAMALASSAQAGTVNVTLTESTIFSSSPTADPGMTYSGSIEVSGYDGSAGLFEVTSSVFEVADGSGTLVTFDATSPDMVLQLDGTLLAEFDAGGNLIDFVDTGDTGSTSPGWAIRSIFYIGEAAGTTKYDLYFDNSPAGGSFWTLFPVTKTLGPGSFGLSFGEMLRSGTYMTSVVTAVPVGPMLPIFSLGLIAVLASTRRAAQSA